MLKLNNRGFAHFMVFALLILGIGIFATYKLVANTTQVAITSSCTNKVLRVGSTGTCVKQLQERLNITQDGSFGPLTEKAVSSFQLTYGLKSDGVVGPATWKALKGKSREILCTYRMKADNTEVVAQGMQYSKCKSLGGKVVSAQSATKVKAQTAVKPRAIAPKAAVLPLTCNITNASSVRVGTAIFPKINVKNNTSSTQIVTISGDIGNGSKGGQIVGTLEVPAKKNRTFSSKSSFNSGTDAKPVTISVKASSAPIKEATCTKTIKVNSGTSTRGGTTVN